MKTNTPAVIILLLATGWAASASAAPQAVAKLIGLDAKPVGRATFVQTPHGVLIEIEARGLKPGAHAVLIHTTASCDPRTLFTSAGPVFSFEPTRSHGYFVRGGMRAGDLPAQFAAGDGTLHATMVSNAFSLGNGKKSIFDRDGASIMVHASGDDYATQPDGNSGARVACGTIIRTVAPGSRKVTTRRAPK